MHIEYRPETGAQVFLTHGEVAEHVVAEMRVSLILGKALAVCAVLLRCKAEIVGVEQGAARCDVHAGTIEAIGKALPAGGAAAGQYVGVEQAARLVGQLDGERAAERGVGKEQDGQRRIEQRRVTADRDPALTDSLAPRHLMDLLVGLRKEFRLRTGFQGDGDGLPVPRHEACRYLDDHDLQEAVLTEGMQGFERGREGEMAHLARCNHQR